MAKKLELDFETADNITLLVLKENRKYLKKDLKEHEKGAWMHPEDVVYSTKLIEALDVIIDYYGG